MSTTTHESRITTLHPVAGELNMSDDVAQRVKEVTARVLKIDVGDIDDTAEFVKDLGAESIQSIELVAAFEEEFDIEMDEDEALDVSSIDTAITFIANVIKEQHG